MSALDVAVLGSLNFDLVVRARRLPHAGETLLGGPFDRHPGGKGANQAVAAARAGARTALIGAVGCDEHGEALLSALAAEGVALEHVARRGDAPTGVGLITVAEDGENTIVVAPGANALVGAGDVDRASTAIGASRVLVAQLETPLEAVERAFSIARSRDVLTLLNAAPARELPRELLAATDVLVVNRGEASGLLGADRASPRALARELAALGPRTVFVTLGSAGAVACEGAQLLERPAFEVAAVDATAAGDAFVGAAAEALVRGLTLETVLERACAAGGLATTRRGAIPSLPTRAQIDELLARRRADAVGEIERFRKTRSPRDRGGRE